MDNLKMPELKPCKKCGNIGVFKSIASGNMAVMCENPLCVYHNAPKSRFRPSQRMAADDWNRRMEK